MLTGVRGCRVMGHWTMESLMLTHALAVRKVSVTIVVLCLCSFYAAAHGAADASKDGGQSREAVTIEWNESDAYQPSELVFRIGEDTLKPRIAWVRGVSAERIASSHRAVEDTPARRTTLTTIRLKDGGKVAMGTSVVRGEPAVSLELHSEAASGRIRLHVANVDRMIFAEGARLRVVRVADLSGDIDGIDGSIVVQDRSTQRGLVIGCGIPGKHDCRWRIAPPADVSRASDGPGVRLEMSYSPNMNLRISVAAFSGDALIALEDSNSRDSDGAKAVWPSVDIGKIEHRQAARVSEANRKAKGGDGTSSGWVLFPDTKRVFKPLLADPREAQLRVGSGYDRSGRKFLDMGLGGDLVHAHRVLGPDREMSISARGLISARFDTCEESFPLLNTDFFGGVASGYRRGKNVFELYFFHESSHLGDETLDEGVRERIDYSREALRLLWSRQLGDLRVYAGPTYNLHARPRRIGHKVMLQVGAEYDFHLWNQPFFAAMDLQSRQPNDWNANITGQIGWYLDKPGTSGNRPRLFLEFFHGHSNMGQYWNESETSVLLGIGANL